MYWIGCVVVVCGATWSPLFRLHIYLFVLLCTPTVAFVAITYKVASYTDESMSSIAEATPTSLLDMWFLLCLVSTANVDRYIAAYYWARPWVPVPAPWSPPRPCSLIRMPVIVLS